jgi:hypothetical protein
MSSEDEEDAAQMCIIHNIDENADPKETTETTELSLAAVRKEKDTEESFTCEAEAWLQRNVMIEYWNGVTNSYMKTGGRCSSISIDW